MSVITKSGSFYTFNVKYSDEPLLLNIEMKDFIHDGSEVNRPNNALDIYLQALGSESQVGYTLSARLSARTINTTSSTSAVRRSVSGICCADSTPTMACSTSIRR